MLQDIAAIAVAVIIALIIALGLASWADDWQFIEHAREYSSNN